MARADAGFGLSSMQNNGVVPSSFRDRPYARSSCVRILPNGREPDDAGAMSPRKGPERQSQLGHRAPALFDLRLSPPLRRP